MGYFLGFDIGGTKSAALLVDENGSVLAYALVRGRVGDYEDKKYDDLVELIHAAGGQALEQAGVGFEQLTAAGLGIAGYDWLSQRPKFLDAIRRAGLDCTVELVNDALIGLLAGSEQGWGIGLVAGTGCNCWGIDRQRRSGQVTGMGGWMGEAAGSGELVTEALGAVSRAGSMRGPQTSLSDAFCRHTGAKDVTDLLEGLTMNRYDLQPSAAPLVFECADQGDAVAAGLVEWAGRSLGDLAVGVTRQLELQDETFEIVMIGSLWKGSPVLQDRMIEVVHQTAPLARAVRLHEPPVTGAALLALQQAGYDPARLRPALLAAVQTHILTETGSGQGNEA